jgi:hypothetical protein
MHREDALVLRRHSFAQPLHGERMPRTHNCSKVHTTAVVCMVITASFHVCMHRAIPWTIFPRCGTHANGQSQLYG